jgi:hypothetical protein
MARHNFCPALFVSLSNSTFIQLYPSN